MFPLRERLSEIVSFFGKVRPNTNSANWLSKILSQKVKSLYLAHNQSYDTLKNFKIFPIGFESHPYNTHTIV